MPRPDRRRSGPDTTPDRSNAEPPSHATDMPMVTGAADGDVCPRCGVRFADTTEDVLRRCAELARAAA
jgi:hypothetical protein